MAAVETKVKVATAGSTVGVALAALVLYLLDTFVYRTTPVPDAIVGVVVTLLPIGLTYLGGWLAPHTVRSVPAEPVRDGRGAKP